MNRTKLYLISITFASFAFSCAGSDFKSGAAGTTRKVQANCDTSAKTSLACTDSDANSNIKKPEIETADSGSKDADVTTKERLITVEELTGVTDTTYHPVDIVFAVDTSGSMSQEKALLEGKMQIFLTKLIEKSKDIPYHVFLLGQGFQFPAAITAMPNFTVINQKVNSNDALGRVMNFFDNQYVTTAKIRPEALKEIVVITDDNAKISSKNYTVNTGANVGPTDNINGAEFKALVKARKIDKVHINGFVGMKAGVNNTWCNIAAVGSEYQSFIQDKEFGGLIQDLCIEDWSKLLENLAERIVNSAARTSYKLSQKADISKPIVVKVNSEELSQMYWSYSSTEDVIQFDPEHAPKADTKIEVSYFVAE